MGNSRLSIVQGCGPPATGLRARLYITIPAHLQIKGHPQIAPVINLVWQGCLCN